MNHAPRGLTRRTALAWLGLAAPAGALAAYPDRPIRLVSPFAAGSGSDFVARLIAQRVQISLKQPCLVENRPGAAGIVGVEYVTKAAPDGYTFAYLSSAITIQPALMKVPYDIQKDLQPVSMAITVPYVLTTRTESRFTTLDSLIAAARAGQPITYGSYGNGSPPHLIMEQVQAAAGVKFTHVPYRNNQTMLTDLLAGLIDVTWDLPSSVLQHIAGGRLKALATSGKERAPFLPDTRALAETVAGLSIIGWGAVMAPAGVPRDVVAAMQKEVAAAVAHPEVAGKLVQQGYVPIGSTSEELARTIDAELASWKTLIREKNIKLDA
jgi:tripartite-type tricarboxylate transporter receptor subunit TctC